MPLESIDNNAAKVDKSIYTTTIDKDDISNRYKRHTPTADTQVMPHRQVAPKRR